MPAIAKLIDRQPNPVMYGDAHPGNVYIRNGAAGLLDWQAVRRGHPGRELLTNTGRGTASPRSASTSRAIALEGVRRGVAALTDPETVAAQRLSLAA